MSTLRHLVIGLMLLLPAIGMAQVVTNVNTSSQNCQGDTITVSFSVTSPFNTGNTFRVELSTLANTFPGTYIEINPLLAASVGSYQMDAIIPDTVLQGAYCIRVVSSTPIVASDTLCNVIIGKNPTTDITIYGTYTFGGEQRFCDGDTAYLVGPPPPIGETHNYQWFNAGSLLTGETDDTLVVTGSGAYSVKVTLGLCDAISQDTIVNAYTPPSDITYTPDPAILELAPNIIRFCEGTVVQLNGPISQNPLNNFKYQWGTDSFDVNGVWHFNPLPGDTLSSLFIDSSGAFYLAVMEMTGGCADTSDFFQTIMDTLPQTNLVNVPWSWQPLPTLNLCIEDSTMLTAEDTVFWPIWKHQWQIDYPAGSGNWIDIPGDTLWYLQVDSSIVADTAGYRIKIENQTCTYYTNELIVNFIDDPIFSFFPGDSVTTCLGDSVLVQLIGNGTVYNWDDGYQGSARWMKNPGEYPVQAVGVNNCTTWDTLKVGIFTVIPNAGPDQIVLRDPPDGPYPQVQLSGSGGVSYFWYANIPAYFNNQFLANPLTQPTADTTLYFVEVTGPNGCSEIDSVWIYVTYPVDTISDGIYTNIQNVISPNDDGYNDVLNLEEITNGDECLFIVLNRWGEEVFRQEIYDNSWNGVNTGGDALPDGTYYFIVQFEDEVRYKGPVTIFNNINK